MGQEWLYKATDSLAPLTDTRNLAVKEGFLCKAAYEKGDKKARADHVKRVCVGDIIHFYFKLLSDPRHVAHIIGTFEVANDSIDPKRFAWPTEATDLVTVTDAAFIRRLKSLGYEDDPQLGVMTGWALRQLEQTTPPYDPDMFPGPRCFVRRP